MTGDNRRGTFEGTSYSTYQPITIYKPQPVSMAMSISLLTRDKAKTIMKALNFLGVNHDTDSDATFQYLIKYYFDFDEPAGKCLIPHPPNIVTILSIPVRYV